VCVCEVCVFVWRWDRDRVCVFVLAENESLKDLAVQVRWYYACDNVYMRTMSVCVCVSEWESVCVYCKSVYYVCVCVCVSVCMYSVCL